MPDIKRLSPLWVVLRQAPGENGWHGLVENSFTMEWNSDRVCIFWTGIAYSILGEHCINGQDSAREQVEYYTKKHPDCKIQAFDAQSPECPIEIDWDYWWEAMQAGARRKYDSRNAKFKIKELV